VTQGGVDGKALLEEALAHRGRVSLARLLTALVPVAALRNLAKSFGLTPKGGHRIDRAPAHILAGLVADTTKTEVIEAACGLLAEHLKPRKAEDEMQRKEAKDKAKTDGAAAALERRERELSDTREELARAREIMSRQRQRLEELDHLLQRGQEQLARLRGEIHRLRRRLEGRQSTTPELRSQTVEIHDLLREFEELTQVETEQRRMLALRQARIRELEEQVAQLLPLVPKGRRKKEPPPEPPPLPERFRRPHFTQAFYKSLENKDRRAVEAAYQAILLFCTEGPGYPGLQAKQLEPPIWSFRAALKLRVYFTNRADGDVDILELADRQEQSTVLRRLREKQ